MTVLLILLSALALLGIGATVHAVVTDGYRSVPDRSPALPDRGRPQPAAPSRAARARAGTRSGLRHEQRRAAAQTR